MQTLSERPGFTILYDPDHRWLYVTWQGQRSNQSARACCRELLTQVRATGTARILNDGSLDLDGWSDLVEWLGEDFFNQLADAGVVAIAWVLPRNLRALTDAHKVMTLVTRPLVNTFTDMEGAHSWLVRTPGVGHSSVA